MARRALPRFTAEACASPPSLLWAHPTPHVPGPSVMSSRRAAQRGVGPLSSRPDRSTRAAPFDPGEPTGCTYPLLHRSCWLRPIRRLGRSHWRNEANSGSLIAAARAFAFRGFVRRITPSKRPVGYMANGSFQGELLSVHETRTVSLTHRITRMPRMRKRAAHPIRAIRVIRGPAFFRSGL